MAKTIDDYKKDYADARARGDAVGMKAANDGANAIRASQGKAAEVASADIAKFQTSGTKTSSGTTTKTSSGTSTKTSAGTSTKTSSGGSSYSGSSSASSSTRKPSTTGVTTFTNAQETIKKKMEQNSLDWHTADASERARLEAENKRLAAQLGGSVAFDSGSGTWSGAADIPQQPQLQAPSYEPANDYSDYINALNKAAREKSLAALKAAYDKNVNAIDAARGQISPQYADARNQAAGQAAIDRKNWQEQAAALGLSSGVAGQAALYQNAALQNNLSSLDRQESSDLSQLELQRTQTESDYNNAIAQAQASGDYELAQQLYQEKIRVDEANRAAMAQQFQQQLQAMQFNYGVSMDAQNREDTLAQQAWQNRFSEEQMATSQANANFNQLLSLASAFADYGDFSGFLAMGMDADAVAYIQDAWRQSKELGMKQAQAELNRLLTSGAGSGGTRTGTPSTPKTSMTLTVAQNMAKQGQFTDEVLDTLRKAGYNDEYIMAAYGWSGPGGTPVGGPTADTGSASGMVTNRATDSWIQVDGDSGRMSWADLAQQVEQNKVREQYDPVTGKYTYTRIAY